MMIPIAVLAMVVGMWMGRRLRRRTLSEGPPYRVTPRPPPEVEASPENVRRAPSHRRHEEAWAWTETTTPPFPTMTDIMAPMDQAMENLQRRIDQLPMVEVTTTYRTVTTHNTPSGANPEAKIRYVQETPKETLRARTWHQRLLDDEDEETPCPKSVKKKKG
jgi:hypothetical protein